MIKPSLEELKKANKEYTIAPISMEIFADEKTTIQVLKRFLSEDKKCYLLESVLNEENWARYSFLGYDPIKTIKCNNNIIKESDKFDEIYSEEPLDYLRTILEKYKSLKVEGFPPFTGGLVGYFSHDCIKYVEKGLILNNENKDKFDDYNFMLFDKVIAFDHFKQKIYLIVNIELDNLEENYIKGVAELKDIEHFILEDSSIKEIKGVLKSNMEAAFSKEEFCKVVDIAKKYIYEGDIFQVVLSNRFEANFEGSLLNMYRNLRILNPSPYMFYMNFEDVEIAGSSPETLVTLKDGRLTNFALAGTCKRGKDKNEDEELIVNLLLNEKELAEHNMLVDLSRNDLGKISKFGTVEVTEYKKILRFSHVSHISSIVKGDIKEGYDQIDAIKAILPAGTLSGAPKRRACEIIEELENCKRGTYGGAVGYIDFTGNMDMCIGIRMAKRQNEKVFVQAGAGVVYESNSENEYQESINKAKGVIEALNKSN